MTRTARLAVRFFFVDCENPHTENGSCQDGIFKIIFNCALDSSSPIML